MGTRLKTDLSFGMKKTLRELGMMVWNSQASYESLNKSMEYYNDVKSDNEELFWNIFSILLNEEKDLAVLSGLLEIFWHIESDAEIENEYLNRLRGSIFELFKSIENESIKYEAFSYLVNFTDYKTILISIVNANKDKYRSIATLTKKIEEIDSDIKYFRDIFKAWSGPKQIQLINLFAEGLKTKGDNIVFIAERIKELYRNTDKKDDINEFFYLLLKQSNELAIKEGVELVLTIYQATDILTCMLKQYNEFAKNANLASILFSDTHICDLSTNISELSGYIEIAAAYEWELLPNKLGLENNNINIIELYKRKKIINKQHTSKLAARKDVILNKDDLIKLNEIYRKTKYSRSTYIDKIKEGFTYNAEDIRIYSGLNKMSENDMIQALENLGIQLYIEQFNSVKFTGCLFKLPKLRKASIVINESLSEAVRNFTIAHELAHFAKSSHELLDLSEDNLYVSYIYNNNEKACDKFASELLLPQSIIKEKLKHHDLNFWRIKEIALEFKTSMEATAIRCIDLTEEVYAMAIYEGCEMVYCHVREDYFNQIDKLEITNVIDMESSVSNVVKDIAKFKDGDILNTGKEDMGLWFKKCSLNYQIKTQVYVQYKSKNRIMVLLQLPSLGNY